MKSEEVKVRYKVSNGQEARYVLPFANDQIATDAQINLLKKPNLISAKPYLF